MGSGETVWGHPRCGALDSDGDGQLDAQAQCTGTVVAPQWIVSAAHCAFRPDDQGVDAMVTLTGDALLIHLRSAGSAPPHAVAQLGGECRRPRGASSTGAWAGASSRRGATSSR